MNGKAGRNTLPDFQAVASSPLSQRNRFRRHHNDMVRKPHINRRQRLLEMLGQIHIGRTQFCRPGRVVVRAANSPFFEIRFLLALPYSFVDRPEFVGLRGLVAFRDWLKNEAPCARPAFRQARRNDRRPSAAAGPKQRSPTIDIRVIAPRYWQYLGIDAAARTLFRAYGLGLEPPCTGIRGNAPTRAS